MPYESTNQNPVGGHPVRDHLLSGESCSEVFENITHPSTSMLGNIIKLSTILFNFRANILEVIDSMALISVNESNYRRSAELCSEIRVIHKPTAATHLKIYEDTQQWTHGHSDIHPPRMPPRMPALAQSLGKVSPPHFIVMRD